jgi:hypothetical protein
MQADRASAVEAFSAGEDPSQDRDIVAKGDLLFAVWAVGWRVAEGNMAGFSVECRVEEGSPAGADGAGDDGIKRLQCHSD